MLEFNAWLPVDRHWIGNVWLFMHDNKPNIYADIDKLVSPVSYDKSSDTKGEPIKVIKMVIAPKNIMMVVASL